MRLKTLGAAMAGLFLLVPGLAFAQYPERPVTVIVPFAAGGTTDVVARLVGEKLSERLGQRFVVENRGGADGNIGAEAVRGADPDGYTLMLTTNSIVVNVHAYDDHVDPIADFEPVGLIGAFPFVLVAHPSVEATSLEELVAYSQENQLFYGATASGSMLATELLMHSSGLKAERIPYRGVAAAMPAILGNEVQIMITGIVNVVPQIQANALVPIVVTGTERSAPLPDVPAAAESGAPGYSDAAWYALYAPAGTPQEIVTLLNSTMNEILLEPATNERLVEMTMEVTPGTPEELTELMHADVERWGNLIEELNLEF